MHHTRKILIAEDDPHPCRYLLTLLDQRNCEIAVERNGEDAIRRAASFQPDVALIGFVMPRMDGDTTGVRLLKVSPHTNVTFITEFVLPEILESLKAHRYRFKTIPAPFEFAELQPSAVIGGYEAASGDRQTRKNIRNPATSLEPPVHKCLVSRAKKH